MDLVSTVGKYCFDRLVTTVFTVLLKILDKNEKCVILNPSPPSDMARVYNFDVKRRSKDNLLKSVKKS